MNDEQIYKIGNFLEHQGFSDESIDAYFEHHGIKGQKWGVRRAARKQGRQLNKASRKKDAANFEKSVEKAREHFSSGKAQRNLKKAKAQFKQDKITMGSREARKILNKTREKNAQQAALSQQAKNGKEAATIMLATVVGAVLVGALTSR